jgi:molybdate transport system substrate-binding protein
MKQFLGIPLAVFLLIAIILSGCVGEQAQSEKNKTDLTVFAAASLTGAMTDIAKDYEALHPDVHIVTNFDGSQALRTQIEQGAYADVFLSANTKHMNALRDQGLMENDTISLFARNKLTVIVPVGNPANITTLKDLARPGTRLVIGTKDVPIGDYARQILKKMANDSAYGSGYQDAVLKNVMSEETTVTFVVAKVQLGEADAGIVYESDVTPENRDKISMIPIPDTFNVIAEYPGGVLAQSGKNAEARKFLSYLTTDGGQTVLARYGFIRP